MTVSRCISLVVTFFLLLTVGFNSSVLNAQQNETEYFDWGIETEFEVKQISLEEASDDEQPVGIQKMTGHVVQCNSYEPVAGAKVTIKNNGELLSVRKTDDTGSFNIALMSGQEIEVEIESEELGKISETFMSNSEESDFLKEFSFCKAEGQPAEKERIHNIPAVFQEQYCIVKGKLYDEETGTTLEGATVKLINKTSLEEQTFMTGQDGIYEFRLEPEMKYDIHAIYDNYEHNVHFISTHGRNCAQTISTKNNGSRIINSALDIRKLENKENPEEKEN